jgi:hypothetical protein
LFEFNERKHYEMKRMNTQGVGRRAFMKSAAIAGAALLPGASRADHDGRDGRDDHDDRDGISNGDAAILRFLAAAETIETDAWQQYTELANNNPDYMAALSNIDGDMAAYLTQQTADSASHAAFINAFLVANNRRPVNLDAFRTLPSSPATGAAQIGRLTNLMHLTVDTSWYLRYRSTGNPDFGDTFPQVVDIVNRPGIPLHDGYTANQIQAIANTGAFHFAMLEQAGSSLYDAMSVKATTLLTLRILTSIGGTEVAHFAIWHDKAGDAPPVDSGDGLVFPDLNANPATATNKVMPAPCEFISPNLPLCSIIRPTSVRQAGAVAIAQKVVNSGLLLGQSKAFLNAVIQLAEEADEATRR